MALLVNYTIRLRKGKKKKPIPYKVSQKIDGNRMFPYSRKPISIIFHTTNFKIKNVISSTLAQKNTDKIQHPFLTIIQLLHRVWLCNSMDRSMPAPLSSLSPRVCTNSCPLSWWYCLTISSSPAPFSFCVQSLPASGSFLMSWLFASDGQSIGASASASASASNEYSDLISFRIYWLDFLAVQGTLKSLLQKHSAKVSIL